MAKARSLRTPRELKGESLGFADVQTDIRSRKGLWADLPEPQAASERRVLEISNAKSMRDRTPLYRELLKMTAETLEQAEF